MIEPWPFWYSFLGWWCFTIVIPVPLCCKFWKWTLKFLLLQNRKSSFAHLEKADISAKHKHTAHLHTLNFVRIPAYEVRIDSKCVGQKIYLTYFERKRLGLNLDGQKFWQLQALGTSLIWAFVHMLHSHRILYQFYVGLIFFMCNNLSQNFAISKITLSLLKHPVTLKRDIFCGDGCSGISEQKVHCICNPFNHCVVV